MNRIRRIAAILSGLACQRPGDPHRGHRRLRLSRSAAGRAGPVQPPLRVHSIVTGGMPGWQIALIAIGAAILAAALAVALDRARTARRQLPAPDA